MAPDVAIRNSSLWRYSAAVSCWARRGCRRFVDNSAALTVLALAITATASGQSLVVTSSGSTVSQGTTLTINTIPNMPNLVLSVNGGSSCDTVSYVVDINYTDQVGRTTTAQYNAQNEPGDQAVTVNWFGGLEGGGASVSWQFDGVTQSSTLGFFINGSNPPNSAVDAYASSGPWFVLNLIAWESRAGSLNPTGQYKQFDSLGYPLWGTPDGIGLMQLEPPNRISLDKDYWSWPTNVADGLSLLNTKQTPAYNSWNNEFAQMQAVTGPNPVYPDETPYKWCDFAYPANGKDEFKDGDWIHYYNGNYFVFFHPADPGGPNRWDIDKYGYVSQVCNTDPL